MLQQVFPPCLRLFGFGYNITASGFRFQSCWQLHTEISSSLFWETVFFCSEMFVILNSGVRFEKSMHLLRSVPVLAAL